MMSSLETSPTGRLSPATLRLLSGLGLLLALLAALLFIITQDSVAWDFRNNLWGPLHLLVQGRSPFDLLQLYPDANAIWFPMGLGAFLPLGYLDAAQASGVWAVLNMAAYVAFIVLAQPFERPKPIWLAFILLSMLLFPPFISHMLLGQYSLMATLMLLLATRYLQRGNLLLAGLCIAVALAKPQILMLPLLGLAFLAWQRMGWRGFIGLGIFTLAFCLLLSLPLWLGYGDWIPDFINNIQRNNYWRQPSLLFWLSTLMGTVGAFIWMLAVLMSLPLIFRLWRDLPADWAIAWTLALNVLVMPYAWTWDFVMLMPLFLRLCFHLRGWPARALLMMAYVLAWLGVLMLRLNGDSDDSLMWWMPWLLVGAMWLAQRIDPLNPAETSPITGPVAAASGNVKMH